MASLSMFLAPVTAISSASSSSTPTSITTTTTNITTTRARRVHTFATATKGGKGGNSSEEKGFFEWLVGALEKDGLVETDPLLQKVEGKSSGARTTVSGRKTVAAPPKKSGGDNGGFGGFGGFGGLFSKK